MTNPTVEKDLEQATLTVTTEFDAPVDNVWKLWSDPRKLEQWWGPPTYPATVTAHDLTPGGAVHYHMTGPEGDEHHGLWRILSVDPPNGFEFEDAFADPEGNPDPELPASTMQVSLTAADGGTRMRVHARYPSSEALQQVLEMGMEEGMIAAMSQIDAVLTEIAAA